MVAIGVGHQLPHVAAAVEDVENATGLPQSEDVATMSRVVQQYNSVVQSKYNRPTEQASPLEVPRLSIELRRQLDELMAHRESVRIGMAERGTVILRTETYVNLVESELDPISGYIRATFDRYTTHEIEDGPLWEDRTTQLVIFDQIDDELISSVDVDLTMLAEDNELVAQEAVDLQASLAEDPPYGMADPSAEAALDDRIQAASSFSSAISNRPAAVEYALRHTCTDESCRNGAYRSFDNNCTNFVSQVMRAGGWKDIRDASQPNSEGAYDPSKWYYVHGYFYSHTWSVADNFFEGGRNSWPYGYNRLQRVPENNLFETVLADIIAADWDRDGRKNHVMVITDKRDGGDRLYTQNTTDKKNQSLYELFAENQHTAWFYASHT